MVKRITIYGWAVPQDRFNGPGSGTLVELIYFLDDWISVGDILSTIEQAGYKMIGKRYPGWSPMGGRLERDRITIEDITVGVETLPESRYPSLERQLPQYSNPFYEGGM